MQQKDIRNNQTSDTADSAESRSLLERAKLSFRDSAIYPSYCKWRGWIPREKQPESHKKVWAFNSGATFTGNPKWLFLYVNRYRKDIDAYWICDSQETIDYVRSLGYNAVSFKDEASYPMQRRTGVFVVEQVKEHIPVRFPSDIVMLNLYHGVGCKTVEKHVNYGFLAERIARKFIKYNDFYATHMLFLVTSPLMEEHFKKQIDLRDENLIRAGYPRCIYQKYYEPVATFDHDVRKQKGLPADAKIAAYVPTYRDDASFDFWAEAVPDVPRLIEHLKAQNMLMIFKLHPQMEKDPRYLQIRETYGDDPHLLFWDNRLDFYEIFNQVDLGIIDYSSIFYDMMAGGVSRFVRYFFDYDRKEQNLRDFVFDLEEMTCGPIANDFDKLLSLIDNWEMDTADQSEFDRINDLFWTWSDKDSMDKIIDQTLEFTPKATSDLPILYSFDIFDTLIARKCLDPEGIFYAVRDRMMASDLGFPTYLILNYPEVRAWCEANAREYYRKTLALRDDDRREITMDMIFARMKAVYDITAEQAQTLMDWELEAEYDNTIPCESEIGRVQDLLDNGDAVILVSDMYLPKEFLQKMLAKASPMLAELPLFLSSECGVQKTTRKLYLQAYLSYNTYNFKKWIHFGDNPLADGEKAKEMGIQPVLHSVPSLNDYERELTGHINSYDAFLTAADFARFRASSNSADDHFAYEYVSLYFIPYVYWAVDHAYRKGTQTLYFISRDGHHLKRIADAIIAERGLPIKTKYIYGSRKAWRLPSFIEDVDTEFFSLFGNFSGVHSYPELREALLLSDEEFDTYFPALSEMKDVPVIDDALRKRCIAVAKTSEAYRKHILQIAAEERPIVIDYLRQEIDFSESFAFVEYWGRGYTQTCFTRLLQYAAGNPDLDDPYYYARSIYPSEGHDIRYNFTSNDTPLLFVEALFANLPYQSIVSYSRAEDGSAVPVITPSSDYQKPLFEAMEQLLPLFATRYVQLKLSDPVGTARALFDFGLRYYAEHQDERDIALSYGTLMDAVTMHGDLREFAPPITEDMLRQIESGVKAGFLTSSPTMSMARSTPEMTKRFLYLTEEKPLEEKQIESARVAQDKAAAEKAAASKEAADKLSMYRNGAGGMQKLYDKEAASTKVQNKLVLFNMNESGGADLILSLKNALKQFPKGKAPSIQSVRAAHPYRSALKELASARYIVINTPSPLMSMIKFRPETRVIRVNNIALHFQEQRPEAVATEQTPQKKIELAQYLNAGSYSVIPAAGQAVSEIMKEIYPQCREAVSPIGAPVTDLFFDEAYRAKAQAKLQELFPEIQGRKIILYMPQYRRCSNGTADPNLLDLGVLSDKLKEDYVLIFHNNATAPLNQIHIPVPYRSFAKDMTRRMTLRQLMVCADILVGDYRNEFSEGTLLGKPMFFYENDQDTYLTRNTPALPAEIYHFCPVVTDSFSLIRQLSNLDSYDFTKLNAFREAYMGGCDGGAAKRALGIK